MLKAYFASSNDVIYKSGIDRMNIFGFFLEYFLKKVAFVINL